MEGWLTIRRGAAPLIVTVPHAGLRIPYDVMERLVSPWLARKDTDWRVDRLYEAAAAELDATMISTEMSRTYIDVNRNPSGAPLYPGRDGTELCPTTTFDGEPLYSPDCEPDAEEIGSRRTACFDPYHAAVEAEIARLSAVHGAVVIYDAHSIRSRIPRLFEGELPVFNIGANDGRTCDPALATRVAAVCREATDSVVVDGRFKGGWSVRRHGDPARGVHAIQMELAARAYMDEPEEPLGPESWPGAWSEERSAALQPVLRDVLSACRSFAEQSRSRRMRR